MLLLICATRKSLQWLVGKITDKITHSITMSTRVTPNSMTNPSRVVTFDRFMLPLQVMKGSKEGQCGFGRTALH